MELLRKWKGKLQKSPLGVGRHKYAGTLTVLARDDVGALKVKRKTDGEWIRVKPTPDAYSVNVGDIFQVTPIQA